MKTFPLVLALLFASAMPTTAQQNQTPGFLDSDAGSRNEAAPAQAGANTTDGTTSGVSGPKSDSGDPPGNRSLPDLPAEALCENFEDEVHANCLSTVLGRAHEPATGVRP